MNCWCRITHLPSGHVVQVTHERSNHHARAQAMRMIRSKLMAPSVDEIYHDHVVNGTTIEDAMREFDDVWVRSCPSLS